MIPWKQYLHQYDNLWPYLHFLFQTTEFTGTVGMDHIKDNVHYWGEITPVVLGLEYEQLPDHDQFLTADVTTVQTP